MPTDAKPDRLPTKKVALFRNGRNQAVRIPREFEFPCKEVIIKKEADHLVLEPIPTKPSLLKLLSSLSPLEERFPDVDKTLLANDEVDL